MVSAGEEAVFRCQHPSARFIDWRVNGSTGGQNLSPDITYTSTHRSGTTESTLSIIAHLNYNGTVVECVAFLGTNGSFELSPAVILQGNNCIVVYVHMGICLRKVLGWKGVN